MHITLVTFDFIFPGIKMLSAYLRSKGIETSLVYLPPERVYDCSYRFSPEIKARLAGLTLKSDLVGFSVMTHNFRLAADLTDYLKGRTDKKIIWGGIHPTISPEECLEHADAVAIGEAEETLEELARRLGDGRDICETPGFWFKQGSEIVRNGLVPPPADLNCLPLPDIGYEGHFIREGEDIVALDRERLRALYMVNGLKDLKGNFYPAYLSVFSRGCPLVCTYCCNNRLASLFGRDRQRVRTRSLDNILAEVGRARELIPELKFITIQDDNFLAQPQEFIREFAERWKAGVGLPFKISGSVHFMDDKRIRPLVESGLMHIEAGIQSGSQRLNREIYRRNITTDKILEAARVLNAFKDRLLPAYDFIFDNPYETSRDRLATAQLISRLPKPYAFSSFSLVYFPGTEIYEMARRDNLIRDESAQIFGKKTNQFSLEKVSYLKLLSLLLPSLPGRISRPLLWRPLALFLDLRLWTPLFTASARFLMWLRQKKVLRRANTSRFIESSVSKADCGSQ